MIDLEIIKMIKTVSSIGKGDSTDDPVRRLVCYYDLDGNLLIKYDTYTKTFHANHDLLEEL
jgi:hypothetical protein